MSLPYEGDSAVQNVAGITGTNSAGGTGVSGQSTGGVAGSFIDTGGGTGVLGQSTGGVAGSFLGDVSVTGAITAQDIVLAGAATIGNTLTVTGNVGIGANASSSKLHVDVASSPNPISALSVDVESFQTVPNSQASHFLRVRDVGSALPPYFDIRGDGNVGIGTTAPNARLEVVQSGTNDGIRVSGSLNPLVAATDGTVRAKLQVSTIGSEGLVGTETNHGFGIYTNNEERVTITSGGRVGFGTRGGIPAAKLHVLADGESDWGIHIQSTPGDDTTSALSAVKLVNRGTGGQDKTWALYTAAVGGGFGVQPNAFEIWEYPESRSRLQIKPGGDTILAPTGGNVGVGTRSQAASLDVVNGVLHVGGAVNPNVTSQGAYLGWNALTGGTGETDFINNQGGGSGGFAFMNTPPSGSPRTTLMIIGGDGNVGIAGSANVGGDLSVGGNIKGTLFAGSVGPLQLANGAVTALAIANSAVTAPAIADGAVPLLKLKGGEIVNTFIHVNADVTETEVLIQTLPFPYFGPNIFFLANLQINGSQIPSGEGGPTDWQYKFDWSYRAKVDVRNFRAQSYQYFVVLRTTPCGQFYPVDCKVYQLSET